MKRIGGGAAKRISTHTRYPALMRVMVASDFIPLNSEGALWKAARDSYPMYGTNERVYYLSDISDAEGVIIGVREGHVANGVAERVVLRVIDRQSLDLGGLCVALTSSCSPRGLSSTSVFPLKA